MAGVRILVVQPSNLNPPEKLGRWMTAAGAELDVLAPSRQRLPDSPAEHHALVVLGGEMDPTDDARHPWLSDLRSLLSSAVSGGTPVLAVGLGAQLLAMATGGQVRAGRKGPEVGPLLVAKRDSAADDPLFGPVPLTPDVMQLHGSEVTTLPPTAQLLASSPRSENQLFRVGEWAYGMQFHIETSTSTVLAWLDHVPELASAVREDRVEPEHLDSFHVELAETWRPVAERFVDMAARPPDQRRPSRYLPLV